MVELLNQSYFRDGRHLENHPVHLVLTSIIQYSYLGQLNQNPWGCILEKLLEAILMCIRGRELLLSWPNPAFSYKSEIKVQNS